MMITRCPACGTMFNVVADQLKVSQGWVRCGQCSDVFDASLHLQEASVVRRDNVVPTTQPVARAAQTPPPTEKSASEQKAEFTDDFAQSLQTAIEASALSKALNGEVVTSLPAPLDEPTPRPVESSRALLNEEIKAEESAAAADSVTFVQQARRQAFWKKTWVQAVLALLAVCLMLVLLLQVVVQQKDYLAMQAPQVKSAVQAICERLGCQPGQLRKIDAVVIDSSTFTKVGPESYKLSFSFKNLGSVAVAMPSLEVTLTDTQDQPLLRRVLLPAQFGAGAALLAPGVDFAGSMTIDVSAESAQRNRDAATARIAGFRLLAFYP